MVLKFIQINIYKGKYLGELLDFLKKENPDFIAAQEVTYGVFNNLKDQSVNVFDEIRRQLNYQGEVHFDWNVKNTVGSLGNAVFSKYPIIEKKVVVLKKTSLVSKVYLTSEKGFEDAPRHLIDCTCDFRGKRIHIISWHGAWTAPPTDTLETLRQAGLVRDYLLELNKQDVLFLVGGDLNSTYDKETVKLISDVANNLMIDSGIKQTTHPKIHKIVPRGFLVDYIFTSDHFKLKKLTVPAITVSDHLPVIAELEIMGP